MFSGKTFALSATGVRQIDLEREIKTHGGKISRTIHKRVDFLVATPAALRRNTQAVRKAKQKFTEIVMVTPEFVHSSVLAGAMSGDPSSFAVSEAAEASTAATATGTSSATATGPRGASLAEIGMQSGACIEVLVEMSDEPLEQWWPARVEAPSDGGWIHPIAYLPLPSRGYSAETPSKARFGRVSAANKSTPPADQPVGADGRLYDVDEGVWRPWRRCGGGTMNAEAAAAEVAALATSESSNSGNGGNGGSSSSSRKAERLLRKALRAAPDMEMSRAVLEDRVSEQLVAAGKSQKKARAKIAEALTTLPCFAIDGEYVAYVNDQDPSSAAAAALVPHELHKRKAAEGEESMFKKKKKSAESSATSPLH